MTTTPLPPAGWYPDPHGAAQLRYWDGAAWTEHLAPPAVAREYASFGRRTVAFLCDALMLLVVSGPLIRLLHWAFAGAWWADVLAGVCTGALWFAYQWFSLHRWRATAGMRLLDVSVRLTGDDARQAIARRATIFGLVFGSGALSIVGGTIGMALGLAFAIGCLMMLGNRLGQTWHDRLSRTQIVDNRLVSAAADGTNGQDQIPPLTASARNLTLAIIALGALVYLVSVTVNVFAVIDDLARRLPQ